MSQLRMTHNDVAKEVAWYIGYGRKDYADLTTSQKATVADVIDSGLRQFYYPPILPGSNKSYEWDFMRPEATLSAWAAVGEDSDDSPVQISTAGSTATSTANVFYDSMVGRTITIKAATGTATTTTLANGRTTLDVSTAVFSGSAGEDWIGATIKFDTSEESYKIVSWTDTDTVVLDGDAAASTGNATDTFTVRIDYTISRYKSATQVTLDHSPSPAITSKLFSIPAGTYRMPSDFAGLHGDLTFDAGEGYHTIPIGNEGRVRDLLQFNPSPSRPQLAALRPVLHTGAETTEQRYDLLLWPAPNALYTLHYRYHIIPQRFNTDTPWASFFMGGPSHIETIFQSCKAAAEHHINDEHGIEWTHFIERVRASASVESTRSREESLGYNGDESDIIHGSTRDRRWSTTVTPPTATTPADGSPV